MRIGILGGTFNPPHLGHLICAQEAYLQLELDRVTLIPARIPPHKPVDEEPGPSTGSSCAAWRSGRRAPVRRLGRRDRAGGAVLHGRYARGTAFSAPESELFLIVGGDIAAGLPKWREPERVLSFATLAVAERRGTSRADVDNALRALRGGERAQFFRMPRIAISSTMLRERVRAGESIRYYTPDPVISYIDRHHLYAGVGSLT